MKPSDDNLLKNLDLINFWEPFAREIPDLRVGVRAILVDQRKKMREVKLNRAEVDSVKPKRFNAPFVFSFNTSNQREALAPLFEALAEKAELISENPDYSKETLPEAYLKAEFLKYSPQMLSWFFAFKGRDREVFRSRYYNFYRRLGQYNYYYDAFKRSEGLRAYVASNDHSGLSQVGFVAARNAGIPTVYIQHASVSENFPPLKSDHAFLDGEDAKEKYLAAGTTQAAIHLIGPMKYDPYLRRREMNLPGKYIGVCVGMIFHDTAKIFNLCEELEKRELPFCIRFHPLMDHSAKAPFEERGWEVSPSEEKAPEFIFRCHTVISGDSNILLEAIILRRRPVYFASDGKGIDYYGFVKHGVCTAPVFEAKEVIKELDRPFSMEEHRNKARRFHHFLGTKKEGKSTQMALELLRHI